MKNTIIDLNNVSFAFNRNMVLENINLAIEKGEMIGIVGPNGGGKTTLLKLMLGLLKPSTGEIRIFGRKPTEISQRIGYVPQHRQFDPKFPVSALDVVLMGRKASGFGGRFSKRDKEMAVQTLAQMNLADKANISFGALSGGQRQRILIARALAPSAEILFFDEPTANVDTSAEKKLYDLLRILNEKITILLVSHDIGFISKYVSTVLCVNKSVLIHPTSELDGYAIQNIYGQEISMIRHDHRCSDKGHTCSNS